MARMPDGWIITVEADRLEVRISGSRELIKCKNCKHFGIKDHWGNFGGVPILAASDVPTCDKWGNGCMTKPDGYCFMAERRDEHEID